MAFKKKGQLTVSEEWAKHLRGYLKRKFWKGERKAEKDQITEELETEQSWTYKNHKIFPYNSNAISKDSLSRVGSDESEWVGFLADEDSNWISFYPFGEWHGGGQCYLLQIGKEDPAEWIKKYPNFISEIREILET
jgi:hypothetical protein